MSDIYIERSHNFDMETARQKAKAFLQEIQMQFGLDIEYNQGEEQDSVAINKMGVDAKAFMTKEKVVFEANLSFLAKPFKNNIEDGIRQGLAKFFG